MMGYADQDQRVTGIHMRFSEKKYGAPCDITREAASKMGNPDSAWKWYIYREKTEEIIAGQPTPP